MTNDLHSREEIAKRIDNDGGRSDEKRHRGPVFADIFDFRRALGFVHDVTLSPRRIAQNTRLKRL